VNRPSPSTTVIAALRVVAAVAAVLVLAAGVQLFVLTERTDRYFSWTVAPPLTAATLGAFYWTSLGLLVATLRERDWFRVRVAFPGVLAFTTLTMVATLLHLSKFHLDSDDPITVFATWAWIVVYVGVPPALVAVLFLQVRAAGPAPPRVAPVGGGVRVALWVIAGAFVGYGAALMVAPGSVASSWPWELTALTARALGAWLIGMGLVVGAGALEADWTRLRPVMVSGVLLAVLEGLALVRYAGTVEWGNVMAWLFVLAIGALAAISASGLARGRAAADG
jgi:hypothetical protein